MRRYQNSVVEVFDFRGKTIEIQSGDITKVAADVIVSSDDNYLSMGGGVSRAIRDVGGSIIWDESREYIPAKLGSVVLTSAGDLQAKYVFHAVVIDFDDSQWPNATIIQSAVKSCFAEANRLGVEVIAMPAMGTGAGGVIGEESAQAMISTVLGEVGYNSSIKNVIFVLDRSDTLFDFFRFAIEKTIKAEYEEKLDSLRQDKDNLLAELRAKTPHRDLPFPIAVARRMIEGYSSFHSKFTATIECTESVVRYCASVVLADRLRLEPDIKYELFEYFNKYANFGSWLNQLEETLKYLRNHQSFSIVPKIYTFYFSKNRARIKKIKEVRDEKHGHGGTLSDNAYQALYEDLIEDLDAVLEGLLFTTEYPLFVVTQTDILDDEFEYQVMKLMGDNVIYSRDVVRSQTLRLSRGVPYLLDEIQQQALNLAPFLIFETCPSCQIQETFFLERVADKELTYHTHRANHRLQTTKYFNYFSKVG